MSKSPGPGADSFRDRKRVRLQALRQMAVTSSPTSMSNDRYASSPSSMGTTTQSHSLDVTNFVEARREEIRAMESALVNAHSSVGKRIFQMLPRYLRRRATSHNVRKLPKVLRAIGQQQNAKAQPRLSRKKRRRNVTLMMDYQHRQKRVRWLETHIWHAKRMRMVEQWGYRLAREPTEKCRLRLFKAAYRSAWIHDASYYECVEVRGDKSDADAHGGNDIISHVNAICDPQTRGRLTSKSSASGAYEFCGMLYTTYPTCVLGPARFQWIDADRLWIWLHPAIAGEVKTILSSKCNALNIATVQLNRFELRGARVNSMLQAVLDMCEPKAPSSVTWSHLQSLRTPASLARGAVLGLNVWDPRLRFPVHMPPRTTEQKYVDEMQAIIARWPANVSRTRLADEQYRAQLISEMHPQSVISARRNKTPIPGSALKPTPSDNRIDIQLIRRSNGWDILVPVGWGRSFWCSLIYAGAKAAGLRDRRLLDFEAGRPAFPHDYPDCAAYESMMKVEAAERKAVHERKPPAKRHNYAKLHVDSPFEPAFSQLQITNGQADAATTPWVVRCTTVLRQLLRLEMVDAIDTALVAIRLHIPKGTVDLASMIYDIPMHDDYRYWEQSLNAREHHDHPDERTDTKAHTKEVMSHYDAAEIMGYVTSGDQSIERGQAFALGFIKATSLQRIVRRQDGDDTGGAHHRKWNNLVLVRATTTLIARPAFMEVITDHVDDIGE